MTINDLYRQASTGQSRAEEELFEALRVRFHAFALRKVGDKDTADEIVQEAMMTIARLYKDEDFEISFSAWAYNVLKNRLREYYRKRRREAERVEYRSRLPEQSPGWQPDPTLESRLIRCLRRICRRNPVYARVLNLKYLGYAVDEITERLSITANHLYVALSRARIMLKTCLEKDDDT